MQLSSKSADLNIGKLNDMARIKKREAYVKPLSIGVTETQHSRFRMLQHRFKLKIEENNQILVDMNDIMRMAFDLAMDKAEKFLDDDAC